MGQDDRLEPNMHYIYLYTRESLGPSRRHDVVSGSQLIPVHNAVQVLEAVYLFDLTQFSEQKMMVSDNERQSDKQGRKKLFQVQELHICTPSSYKKKKKKENIAVY